MATSKRTKNADQSKSKVNPAAVSVEPAVAYEDSPAYLAMQWNTAASFLEDAARVARALADHFEGGGDWSTDEASLACLSIPGLVRVASEEALRAAGPGADNAGELATEAALLLGKYWKPEAGEGVAR